MFIDHFNKPREHLKRTVNFNLTLSKYVNLFSRHVNSQVTFYMALTEGDSGKQWAFWSSATTAKEHMIFFFQK